MRTDRVARVRAGFGRAALAQQRTLFVSRWELSTTDRGYTVLRANASTLRAAMQHAWPFARWPAL